MLANNSCKDLLGQTAARVCKPYLGVDQDQQYRITLIELKVTQILNFALIWPTQLCAAHGTVLGGIGQGYSYLVLNWYKIYLFSEGFHRMPFWTDQKF